MRATAIIGLALLGLMASTLPPVAQADTGPMPARGLSFVWPDGTTGMVWGEPVLPVLPLADQGAYEDEVIRLTNAERTSRGLWPLKENTTLTTIARAHNQDMIDNGFFDHTGSDGRSPAERACDAGFAAYGWGACYVGENIAGGYSTPASVMQAWMNSSGHRANILHPQYREIGVGYNEGGYYGRYWTMDLGSRPLVLPAFINDEADSTESRNVTLTLTDETVSSWGSIGRVSQVLLGNDPAFTGSTWQPYTQNKSWTLSPGNGTKTVYVRYKDGSGNTAEASDQIVLNEPIPVLSVSPTSLAFLSQQASGQAIPISQTVSVSNAGGGTLTWDFSSSGAWLQVSRHGENLGVQPSGFGGYGVGHYSGHITVTATTTNALSSPQVIPMTGNSLCTTPCSIGVEVRLTVAETVHVAYLPLLLK